MSSMSPIVLALLGSLAAGLMTAVGALPAFVAEGIARRTQNILLGFGAGVMLAATAFSLIMPGLEHAQEMGDSRLLAATIVSLGILGGGGGLWFASRFVRNEEEAHGPYDAAAVAGRERMRLFVLAITLHNFPEGLAVGVGFGGGDFADGTSLAIGIGLQNMPEGLAVALAAISAGDSAIRGFIVALLSGLIEPVGGLLGAGVVSISQPLLPWMLALAAGAMLFVISQEVIPEMQREEAHSINTFGLLVGFVVMMMLDVVLG